MTETFVLYSFVHTVPANTRYCASLLVQLLTCRRFHIPRIGQGAHVVVPSVGSGARGDRSVQERLIPPSEKPYELFHEARDVLEGDKFACRTMVDYVFPDAERARLSNLADDVA